VHAVDFGHRTVIQQPPAMRETDSADQTVEREGVEDICHGAALGLVRGKGYSSWQARRSLRGRAKFFL